MAMFGNEELMRQESPAPEREGGAGHVPGNDRGDDRNDQRGLTSPNRRGLRKRFLPLSLRASLVLILLAPIAATVGFASATAVGRWSSRNEAVTARTATLELDALMTARAAIADEDVPTAAIVYAAAYHVSPAVLDSLLGIDFEAELAAARQMVDRQTVLRTTPSLEGDYAELMSLRSAEAQGKVSYAAVQAFFGKFGSAVDASWLSSFATLSRQVDASAPLAIRNSLNVLRSAFTAFTAGLQQTTFAVDVLTTPSTTAQVEGLIVATEQFASSVQGFPGQLGPRGAAAWEALSHSPQVSRYNASVQVAIQVGLRHEAPPYATNLKAHAGVFTASVERAAALTTLVLAAAADLLAASAVQEAAATGGLVADLGLMALLLVVALGGVALLSRAAGQPLARIVSAAGAVRAGDFDLAPLDESGPKELALAAGAFNEMSATLRAVEAHAVALADNDLDNPALRSPLPGRTGRAFQVALDQLHDSMRANEEQRDLLHVRATHDSLTGLLNRGAAVEALNRDLARARRGGQVLALLFIDLDGLKGINDSFGHEGGDAAIRAIADALRVTTRQEDVVARIGGDEFIVACLGAPDLAGTTTLAERIRLEVSATVTEVGGQRIDVACSIGIALSEPSDDSVDPLMNRADQALYLAKAEGRDRVRWLESALESPTVHVTAGRRPSRGRSPSQPSTPVG
jgi:diguanylate cyclase (GGDEF)-like protein